MTDAVSLAEYIAENKTIMRIDIRDNDLQAAGLMAIALAIKHNKCLTNLDLNQNTITSDPVLFETSQVFINDIQDQVSENYKCESRGDFEDNYIQVSFFSRFLSSTFSCFFNSFRHLNLRRSHMLSIVVIRYCPR